MPEGKSHPAPAQAALIILILVPVIGLFLVLGSALGVAPFLFVGFVFILYWTAIKGAEPAEFAPALFGCLGGLGLAYLLHILPTLFGIAGMITAGAGIVASVYLLIRGQVSVLVNPAFMLLLTLGNPIVFERDSDFAAAAVAIVAAAIYAGGLIFLMNRFSAKALAKPK